MVLLDVLRELAPRARWTLAVAHLNHRLRGRSSDADGRLVRKKAKELNLRCFVEAADVRKLAVDDGISIEMAARRLRHEFLARVAREQGIQTIALAHHADDQVELFFLRLLRGTGSEGLGAMKWSNPSPEDSTVKLVRPLLGCSKMDLRRLASERKIPFREDASNTAQDIMRNRIRHDLLPLLQKHY